LRRHLKLPLFLYLPLECLRQRVVPDRALLRSYAKAMGFALVFSFPTPAVKGIRALKRGILACHAGVAR
jgi:hypothetical protein